MSDDWKQGGAAYLPLIGQVEHKYGLPQDLLARVAFQECSWRADVIFGRITSPAGAIGMFQLMPQFFAGAGISWQVDAQAAAKYLITLFGEFEDWKLAVSAYNWGPSNVRKFLAGDATLPHETARYVSQVFEDVPEPGALA